MGRSRTVRYQPDQKPPVLLALGLGLQLAALNVATITLIPMAVIRVAGGTEADLSWVVFAAVAVCGAATVMQAIRVGRIGGGQVLLMGSSGPFIGVCVSAVAEGGPAMLATLVVVSSLVPIVLSAWLSLFRRILTPTVSGTIIMLVPVTVMPIVLGLLDDVPEGTPAFAAPTIAFVTVVALAVATLASRGVLRLWGSAIGVAAGTLVAGWFGLFDVDRVVEASWFGLPDGQWPGFDGEFGPAFWVHVPAFLLLALIGAIRTASNSVANWHVSWHPPRAVNFRAVQGAVTADGVGNLLAGLAGTMPNTAYSTSVSATELSGVAAPGVGIAAGMLLVTLAFSPKAIGVILAIPGPVAGACIAVMMALIFLRGIRTLVQDGLDERKGMSAAVAFWVGVGCQYGLVFPEYVSGFAGGLLQNGITAGGLAAMMMAVLLVLTEPRRSRMEGVLELSVLPKLQEFLGTLGSRSGWDAVMERRLDAVGEEALLALIDRDELVKEYGRRHFVLTAYLEDGDAVLEFVVAPGEGNLQDRLALLGDQPFTVADEQAVTLRLLQHFASSVRHQQYYDTDVLTLRVNCPDSTADRQA